MPRERLRQVLVLRYLNAVIAVAAAAGVRALSSGVGDARAPYLPFVIAVIVAATFGGLGPGLLSMALSALAAAWWPVPGGERFSGTMADWTNLALFLGVSGVILWLAERTRRGSEEIRRVATRERGAAEVKGAILATALDPVISMDTSGRIVDFNPAAERTFGFRREDIIGKTAGETIVPERLREAHRAGLERFVKTGEAAILGRRIEMPALRADGSEFPVELAVTMTHGDRILFTAYLRDLTERRRAEEEREDLLARERAARSEAERASHMKDEFLSTLSHELRTPLQGILGWSQLLGQGGLGESETTRALATIERNARAQTQIIEDLLDLSRIVSGKLRLQVQPVDLASVIHAALETVAPAAEAKGIRLQHVLDPRAVPFRGDPNRLQQVVWNLLSNAIKFTPRGGRVQVHLEKVDSHLEISIGDTGQGIAPEFLPHVFERFRQADASTTRQHGGLGIGLAIVRELVELHGGSVRVKSPGVGQGTTFTIILPLAVVEAREGEPERVQPASAERGRGETSPPSLRGLKVLLVEDEPETRELLTRILRQFEAEVVGAGSVAEALDRLEGERPDLIVSDIGMPGEDGYDLIRKVRARSPERGGRIPAVALTAFARPEDRQRALLSGFGTHLAKPVEPWEVVAVVAALAGRTGREAPSVPEEENEGGTKTPSPGGNP